MTLTAQLGTAQSQLGQIVLGYWTFTLTPPDVQPVWMPLWLVEPDHYASYALDALVTAYQGRLLNSADVTITRELADSLWSPVPAQGVTVELDNADGALTPGYATGLTGRQIAIGRYDVRSGTSATKFQGVITWPRLSEHRLLLECGVLDRELLTEQLPAPVVTTATFPNAVDVGATIPVVFGNVPTMPCPNVNDDKINSRFDYLVGHGTLALTALARNGQNDSLYSIQFSECLRAAGGPATSWAEVARTDLYPGYTVVRFILRQSDFSNSLHKIYATVTGMQPERNFARAVGTLLSNTTWGLRQTVDAASVNTAAAILDALPVPLSCDGALLGPRAAQDWLTDLLMVRGMWLDQNAAGAITLHVAEPRSTVAMAIGHDPGDGPKNIVDIRERAGPAPDDRIRQVTLKYRRDYVRDVCIGQVQRAVNPDGMTRTIEHAFLRDAASADLVTDFIGKRIKAGQDTVEVTVTQEGRALTIGDIVRVTNVKLGYYGDLLEVWKIAERLTTLTLTLRGWSWATFTYTSADLATDPLAGTEQDFSRTVPSAATGLGLSSSGTTMDGQGKVSAWVILAFTNPTTNFASADVLYRLTGATEYSLAATNITPGATTARVEGLAPGTSYDYAIRVTNAFALTAALATLAAQTTPTDASVPGAANVLSLTQTGALVVEIHGGFTIPADWAVIQVYRNTVNNSATATMILEQKAWWFHDASVTYGTTYYYWLRVKDTSGNIGPFGTGASITIIRLQTNDHDDATITTPKLPPNAASGASWMANAAVNQARDATQALVAIPGLSVSRTPADAVGSGIMVNFAGIWLVQNTSAVVVSAGVGVNIVRDGATNIAGAATGQVLTVTPGPGNSGQVTVTVPIIDFPGTGTHTYTVTWIVQSTNVSNLVICTCQQVVLEAIELKR